MEKLITKNVNDIRIGDIRLKKRDQADIHSQLKYNACQTTQVNLM